MKILKNNKRKIYVMINNHEVDEDFWENLEDDDLKEAIEEYVRDSDDISIWVD